MRFLYNTGIVLYYIAIRIAAISNKKAQLWISGRKRIFEKLVKSFPEKQKTLWMHCASLGEFEQGRPLLEEIRKNYPQYKLLLTFFSPSGYEIRKNYDGADVVCYLPLDTPANAKRFVKIVNPDIALFVKYEFWFNYQQQLKKRGIPLFVVSANFRSNQHFFKWYGGWFRKNLKNFTHLFVQNEFSKKLLLNAGITDVTVSGDTRFDRVAAITQQVKSFPLIEQFCNQQKVFIAGSTWKPDEEILCSYFNLNPKAFKYIIAPHEVNSEHIENLCVSLKVKYILYSKISEQNVLDADVLIIDSIGILSHVYQYGYITYIGGGFGKSIHNILEPATFGMPVVFGPNHTKFAEAIELKNMKGAFAINNAQELNSLLENWISDSSSVIEAALISKNYVARHTGACNIIMNELKSVFPTPQ